MPAIWRNPSSRWRRDQGDRTGAGRHARKRAAERLGAVRNWVRTYREGGMTALRPENRNASQTNKPAPRRSRNARAVGDDVEALRRRVEELELENALMREVVEARRKRPRHRAAEHAVVHGPHGVFHPRGQGVPVARDRLLRRHAGRPDDRHQPGLGVGQRHARRRVLHAQGRRETNHPSRPWLPLPVARVDPHPQGQQPDAFDGRERLFSGQRRRGGLLPGPGRSSSTSAASRASRWTGSSTCSTTTWSGTGTRGSRRSPDTGIMDRRRRLGLVA